MLEVMKRNSLVIGLAVVMLFVGCRAADDEISLAGEWRVALDSTEVGEEQEWFNRTFANEITLPGTLDEAGYGVADTLEPSVRKPQILHLTRKHSYVGPAWYVREVDIPSAWEGRTVTMRLERVLWQTRVWVDGKPMPGAQESLSAPHEFDLTEQLTPGRHKIALRVDNRKRYDISVNDMAHAYTNETQVMWNGVLGKMILKAGRNVEVDSLRVYPDAGARKVRLTAVVRNRIDVRKADWKVTVTDNGGEVVGLTGTAELKGGNNRLDICCPLGDSVKLWDEFHPHLYNLALAVSTDDDEDCRTVKFGLRDLHRKGNEIQLNGHKIFLRGTLECCIFPQTGRPPMQPEGWEKVFVTAREWGLNHLRFHSWCPPEAAFQVADSLGFYLQVELPLWPNRVGEDAGKNAFLYSEADRILAEYGNHPSFCFLSLGNELPDDFAFLAGLLKHVKRQDSRHLYTTTSFSFENGHGGWPEADDDYWVTQWTQCGWVRGQGVFDALPPRFDTDYSEAITGLETPVVSHEIGQYAVYPNLKEIEKYVGTLRPLNFMGVREELERKGLDGKAADYTMASGRLAYLLYKEEIERALKTGNFSGFQLLDLHDFPGQGTALVGLLDAFWDNKGIVEPAAFRQFCAPVVPLAYFPKAVYTQDETFEAGIGVANYSDVPLTGQRVAWTLATSGGRQIAAGEFVDVDLAVAGNNRMGTVCVPLEEVREADDLQLTVSLCDGAYSNSWKVWVYPSEVRPDTTGIVFTDNWDEARVALEAGRDVFLNPDYHECHGLEGKFVPVFWSPVHFPSQAGTMGILLDPKHEAFACFPTDFHTDWQWWHLTKQSKVICTDGFYKNITPLVECVDNFVNNRRLSSLFEACCGKGRLLFCSMDLTNDMETHPEKRQLLYSLLRYMNSDAFRPACTIRWDDLYNSVHINQEEKI